MARFGEIIEDTLRVGEHDVKSVKFHPESIAKFENVRLIDSPASSLESQSVNKRIIRAHFETLVVNDSRFSQTLQTIWRTTKLAGITTAIGLSVNYVYNYMYHNSGPFYTIDGHKYRIKDPYACGFMLKSGDVVHPLDAEIKAVEPDPCRNYKLYDLCGGWCDMKRLRQQLPPESIQKLKGSLSCENKTIADALRAMADDVTTKVSEAVFGTHSHYIIALLLGSLTFCVSKLVFQLNVLICILLSVITIVLFIILIRKK